MARRDRKTSTTDLDLLRELCAAPSPTGFEGPVQSVVRRRLSATAETAGDPLGNVWADVAPDGAPHVLVTGHCDQIGLIVTYVDDHGYVSFDAVGGVDRQLLPGRHLVIHGHKGPVDGVVGRKPTHVIPKDERGKAPELHEQWVDIGAGSRDEALGLVAIGDPITFQAEFLALANGRYASPAFDDRAGVYVALRALEHYAAAPANARLTALSTVHEETTFMGARAAALRFRPDVAVVVDADFASDDPGVDPKKLGGEVKLGGGPIIHRGAASNRRLVELALEVAAAEGIPHQVKAVAGATQTDAEELMASVQTATLSFSLPVRYMHSALEVMDPDDAEAGALLAAALTRRLAQDWTPQRFVPGV
ncbi:MAG: M42 family peptidase [Thermoleophilia bacterium]|jgi:endoglucanase|nr:M42 family peptidase [Thermoleophilia bacterium]